MVWLLFQNDFFAKNGLGWVPGALGVLWKQAKNKEEYLNFSKHPKLLKVTKDSVMKFDDEI